MSAYDYNPDVCLQVIHRIAEEIPSGVSGRDLKAIYPKITFSQELLGYIKNTIITVTKRVIDWMWIHYNIPEKLKYLRELEAKSPKHDAWRPKTGDVNLNSIKARNLLKRKRELIKQIELVREESEMTMLYIKAFSEQSKKQLEEINLTKEKYKTI
ncbi:uncharacterized protein LOC108909239 [Anoplophora glabripennis]|uniref:uncharacterized protein LOC108909239 n=1 Tax=Anoplophora glabripennis TaxID=217634 RepID=UPI000874D0D0|nr:uncharacterized protein LOC108909239 [Anoplophora glabripennis]